MENKKLNNKSILSFAVGDIYGGGAFFVISALYLFFLTDVGGLTPAYAGLVIMVGKIWDAVSDPAMGYISDHTGSKHGRRRLYFIIGIIPIMISFALLWISFKTNFQAVKLAYYLLTYLLFNTVFTMVMVPYNSLPAEMTEDYKERSKLISIRMLCSQFGALLGAVLPMTIVNSFGNEGIGFIVMGIIFGVMYGLPWLFVFKGTWENEYQVEHIKGQKLSKVFKQLFKEFLSTRNNKSLKIHIAMFLCAFVAIDIFNALLIYYIKDYLHKDAIYQLVLGIVLFTEMLTLFFVYKECSKKGNAKTYRLHTLIWVVGILILGTLSPSTPNAMFILVAIIAGIGLSGAVMVPYNMLAFVTDVDIIISRRRRAGTYAGIMTFLRKMTQAIALFLVSLSLEWIGYQEKTSDVENIVQSESTIMGIRLIFIIAPLVLILIGIIASYQFKLDPSNHQLMLKEIDRLRAGGSKQEVDTKTKEVCEAITGVSYENLWEEVG